jgi:carboxyl-terminal processing protease
VIRKVASLALPAALLCAPTIAADSASDVDSLGSLEIAMEILESSYLGEAERVELEAAAIDGMLRYLDRLEGAPANRLLDEAALEVLDARERGLREGIGAEFLLLPDRGLLITEVHDDSPARRAGMQPGQAVVAMFGETLTGRSPEEIHTLVHREDSAQLEITLVDTDGTRRDLTLQREFYPIEPIRVVRGQRQATLRILSFDRGCVASLADVLQDLDDLPLVIDLRDNNTGDLVEAVAAADLMLPEGTTIGWEARRRTGTRPLSATRPPAHEGAVVLLVNRGTAGVAELFAAALQEHGRALLVGTTTAGNARAAGIYALPGASAMELVDSEFSSPAQRSWHVVGLRPDHLEEESLDTRATGLLDKQLERASTVLREQSASAPDAPD